MVHTPRRSGRERTRILYWFRTPPGIRVGRAPLDEDAIRLLEEYHRDIPFDWPQILGGAAEPAARGADTAHPAELRAYRPLPHPGPIAEPPPEPTSPAHARVGSEGLARLRGRHAEVAAAISRRVQDDGRRKELLAQADALNPDTWVTDDEVQRGLEQYEGALAALRDLVGRRRRRKRPRPAQHPEGAGDDQGPIGTEAEGAEAGTGGQDEDDGDEPSPAG